VYLHLSQEAVTAGAGVVRMEGVGPLPLDQLHRLGHLHMGEVSVAIAVAAPHRAEALEACRWLIDTLKAEVPIFKKEAYAGGEVWVDDHE